MKGRAIYGVGKLAALYREFTQRSVFTPPDIKRVKPTCGGNFFGGTGKEMGLDKSRFRVMISVFCHSELQNRGVLPVSELLYFKAENQKHYQSNPTRYFQLVKAQLFELDRQVTSLDCVWCFFPMYHRAEKHLFIKEISAFVFLFKRSKSKNNSTESKILKSV